MSVAGVYNNMQYYYLFAIKSHLAVKNQYKQIVIYLTIFLLFPMSLCIIRPLKIV